MNNVILQKYVEKNCRLQQKNLKRYWIYLYILFEGLKQIMISLVFNYRITQMINSNSITNMKHREPHPHWFDKKI